MFRLRQIAWVARDLGGAERAVEDSLGLSRCFRDPGVGVFGLRNALYPVGDQFLEIVSPVEEGTTAGRLLERRGGDAGYMVILQTDDLDPVRRRADELGIRIVFTADGGEGPTAITGLHFHPRDVGGAILSVDRSAEPAEWAWAGPEWRDHVRTDTVSGLTGATLAVEDPAEVAARWRRLLGAEGADERVELDDAVLTFVDVADDRAGLVGIDLSGAGPVPERLVGTDLRLAD